MPSGFWELARGALPVLALEQVRGGPGETRESGLEPRGEWIAPRPVLHGVSGPKMM